MRAATGLEFVPSYLQQLNTRGRHERAHAAAGICNDGGRVCLLLFHEGTRRCLVRHGSVATNTVKDALCMSNDCVQTILTLILCDVLRILYDDWANSLVDVCGAAFKSVTNDAGRLSVLHTQMRAASGGLHTVPSTLHRSRARARQEGAELATEITHDGSLVRIRFGEEITHLHLVRHCFITPNDNDNDTLREVPHLSMRAWPYRQERRGHGPTKKDLS